MTGSPDQSDKSTATPRRNMLAIVCQFCCLLGVDLAFAGTLAALIVHWTIKDSSPIIGPFFYMTPPPVIFAAAVLCALAYSWLKVRRRSRFAGVVVLCLLPVMTWVDWAHHPRPAVPSSMDLFPVRVMFWNVARRSDLTASYNFIRDQNPDIVGLVEVAGNSSERRQQISAALPGYDVSVLGGNMLLLSKWPSGKTTAVALHAGSVARLLEVNVRGTPLNVVVADIDAYVTRSRAAPLTRLREFIEPLLSRPTVVMGDFNTPIDSVYFQQFRRSLRNLFEASGNGYGPTWPYPLPVLQLDQMWVSEQVRPVSCWHVGSLLSDHRAVVAEILLPAAREVTH